MQGMNIKNTEHKTVNVTFRVTPSEYEKLLDKFGTIANLRDFILEIIGKDLRNEKKRK